jgi:prepilin peptidase CpaA
MNLTSVLDRIQLDLLLHGSQYRFYIEIAAVAVLLYVGFTDFRTFKIRNDVLMLLVVLYVPLAIVSPSCSWGEVVRSIALAVLVFAVLLWFFAQKLIGGGDVKLLSVACLWVGAQNALLFSALLLIFLVLHVGAARMGWANTKPMGGRNAIPYAPSVAGAMIGVILYSAIVAHGAGRGCL